MKHIDLFSGIGGFALAARWTWGEEYENVGHCEIDEYACKIYHKHFERSEHYGDITKVEWREGQAELVTGGFPCQPHSVAGKRMASTDERDLWGECIRALCGIRPKYALFENVPGLLTSERGRFFNRVLADLARSGYDAEWEVIPACAIGAPHTRERVWILAYPHKERCVVLRDFSRDSREKYSEWGAWKFSVSGSRDKRGRIGIRIEPDICRMANGLPATMDRIAGLGNAIVPQVARVLMEAIKQHECSKHFA